MKQPRHDLVEHILNHCQAYEKEVFIVARVDYLNSSDTKNYIKYEINGKELNQNFGILYLTKKQDYFKTSQEMVIYFIKEVFGKHISLNSSKKFSKYKISRTELEIMQKKFFTNNLENILTVTPSVSRLKI